MRQIIRKTCGWAMIGIACGAAVSPLAYVALEDASMRPLIIGGLVMIAFGAVVTGLIFYGVKLVCDSAERGAMRHEFDIEELTRPDGFIPVDVETTGALAREVLRLRGEVEKLRAALLEVDCPGGGYTGQPEGEERNVANCIKAGVCGCTYGAALRAHD